MVEPRNKTTVVGSYPIPDWLAAAPSEQSADRWQHALVLQIQEHAGGIDLVCDGELLSLRRQSLPKRTE